MSSAKLSVNNWVFWTFSKLQCSSWRLHAITMYKLWRTMESRVFSYLL